MRRQACSVVSEITVVHQGECDDDIGGEGSGSGGGQFNPLGTNGFDEEIHAHNSHSTISNEGIFLQDFLVILKQSL